MPVVQRSTTCTPEPRHLDVLTTTQPLLKLLERLYISNLRYDTSSFKLHDRGEATHWTAVDETLGIIWNYLGFFSRLTTASFVTKRNTLFLF